MTIYEVKFPAGFDVADSVQPNPVPGADGLWYFTVYGKQDGAPAKTHMCRWGPNSVAVEFLTLERYTTARGAPAVGALGKGLWLWSFDTGKKLFVQSVPDWTPPVWMVNDLAARVVALEARAAGGTLSERHAKALDALCRLMGI